MASGTFRSITALYTTCQWPPPPHRAPRQSWQSNMSLDIANVPWRTQGWEPLPQIIKHPWADLSNDAHFDTDMICLHFWASFPSYTYSRITSICERRAESRCSLPIDASKERGFQALLLPPTKTGHVTWSPSPPSRRGQERTGKQGKHSQSRARGHRASRVSHAALSIKTCLQAPQAGRWVVSQ